MVAKDIDDELKQLREDLAALAKDVKNIASKGAAAGEAAAKEGLEDLQAEAESRLAALEGEVVKRPLTSLMIAFCAGMIFSKLLDR